MSEVSREVLEKLRKFDTPTICNLIELFNVRPRNLGYMDARIKAVYPDLPPMVGFAATATHRSAGPPVGYDPYQGLPLQLERFGELSGPPVVVFEDLDDPAAAASFGEVMCTSYKAFGAVGLITSGAGRDIDQVRVIDFPLFTNGALCAHGYTHIPDIHVPAHVGGIVVYPDDLLHGDLNGVTTIPLEIAAEVADIGDDYIAAEVIKIGVAQAENLSLKVWLEAQKEGNAQIASLRARVSRKRD